VCVCVCVCVSVCVPSLVLCLSLSAHVCVSLSQYVSLSVCVCVFHDGPDLIQCGVVSHVITLWTRQRLPSYIVPGTRGHHEIGLG